MVYKSTHKMRPIQSALDNLLSIFQGRDANDRELKQLTKTVRKTMSMQKREVKGIGDIVFTVGKKETNKFQAENASRRDSGESCFIRVKNDIGSKENIVVIWIKLLSERSEFMTDLVLSCTRRNHEHFFFGDKDGYSIIAHPGMRGISASDPALCLWFKKDIKKHRHISDLRVSYTIEERNHLKKKNYEMLPLCLSKFGLGYANIWILWTSCQIIRLTSSDHIEKELKDYNAMLARSPDDPILIKMVGEAERRLRDAQLQEEDHSKDIPGDSLIYTRNFLALTKSELDKMCSIFSNGIDYDRDGKILVEDYVLFLCEPLTMSPFFVQIFSLSSSTNAVPTLDIGSTLKATAIFCMLCSSELLRCIFAWYDVRGYGVINNREFLELLGIFHPRHRDDRVIRALKEVDLPEDGTMPYDTFEAYHKRFPHLFYPAFRVQEKMRQRFMGVRWWKRKLERYAEAKERLKQEENTAQAMEIMERRQRYELARELSKQGSGFFEVKKRRRRKFRE